MNQHTRAEEPSMDEILASIRRIIAEDGSKPTTLPLPAAASPMPAEPAPRPAAPVVVSPAASEAPSSLSAKLNDAFGYAPGADPARPLPAGTNPRMPVKTSIDDDLADILSDTPLPRPAPATAASAPGPAFSTPAPNQSPPAPSSVRPTDAFRLPDAPLAPAPAPAAARPVEPAPPPPGPVASAPTVPPAAVEPSRPGPIVIAAAPRLKPSVEATLPPRATPAAAPLTLSALNGHTSPPATPASPTQPKPAAAGPVVLAAMPPATRDKPGEPVAPAVSPASAPEAPTTPSTAAGQGPLSSLKAPEPAHVADDASAAAVANALGSLEAGLAAVNRPAAPEIVVAAEEVVPSPKAATTAPSPGPNSLVSQQAAPAPANSAYQGESVFSKPSAFIGGVALTPIKSFDDTAAELLRPMLRDWLDTNMPRIVEKALKIEITGTREALPKPSDVTAKPSDKG